MLFLKIQELVNMVGNAMIQHQNHPVELQKKYYLQFGY